MLPEPIVQHWREEARVGELARALLPTDTEQAEAFFRGLGSRSAEDARRELANRDASLNRKLAWVLLLDALKLDPAAEYDQAMNLVNWADFTAEFGDALRARSDALEAHCQFYRGVLKHRGDDLSAAHVDYMRAEASYRDARASLTLQGLAVFAAGAAAHAAGATQSDRLHFSVGSAELFQRALEMLRRAGDMAVIGDVEAAIERTRRQDEMLARLRESAAPQNDVAAAGDLVDAALVRLLRRDVMYQAFEGADVAKLLEEAQLAEQLGAQVGSPQDLVGALASYYINRQQHANAEYVLRHQLETHPADVGLLTTLANTLLLRAEYSGAATVLRQVLELDADNAQALATLSTVLLQMKDVPGARSTAQRALGVDPRNAMAKLVLQEVGPAPGPPLPRVRDGTLELSEDWLSHPPDEVAAAITAATLLAEPSTFDARFAELQQSNPGLARQVLQLLVAHGIARTADAVGEPRALSAAQQHFTKAESLFGQAKFAEALAEYALAAEADPNMADAYMGLGDVYYRLGQYYVAIAMFEESLAIKPMPSTYRFLGDAYRHIGTRQKAVESYQRALELDPDYGGARDALNAVLREN